MSDWKSEVNRELEGLDHVYIEKEGRKHRHRKDLEHFFVATLPEFVQCYREAIHHRGFAIEAGKPNGLSVQVTVTWHGIPLFTSKMKGEATAECAKLSAETGPAPNVIYNVTQLTSGLAGVKDVNEELLASFFTARIKENAEKLNKQL